MQDDVGDGAGDGGGLGHEQLPRAVRRALRFGGSAAADLAELNALRREIDGISARLGRALAGQRAFASRRAAPGDWTPPDPPGEADALQAAWVQLRDAGLALLAEIERRSA